MSRQLSPEIPDGPFFWFIRGYWDDERLMCRIPRSTRDGHAIHRENQVSGVCFQVPVSNEPESKRCTPTPETSFFPWVHLTPDTFFCPWPFIPIGADRVDRRDSPNTERWL